MPVIFMDSKKGSIEIGTSTIIIIIFAIVVLVAMLFFANNYLVKTGNQLGNFSSGLNITIPQI